MVSENLQLALHILFHLKCRSAADNYRNYFFSCSLFAGFNVPFALGDKLMNKPSSKLAQSSGTRDCFIVFMIQ